MNKKFIIFLILVFLVFLGTSCSSVNNDLLNSNNTEQDNLFTEELVSSEVNKNTEEFNNQVNLNTIESTQSKNIEVSFSKIKVLPVPFTTQAPFANWGMPYQEACEEASIIMVMEYLAGRKNLQIPPAEAEELILELIKWQEDNGYGVDLTAAEVVKVLADKYDKNADVLEYSAEIIRNEINNGRPVIIPTAGRQLGNPYFRRPGPLYHMLVVKGYEGSEFIVNDPGTKRGESYRYTEKVLAGAVRDWNNSDVMNGRRIMIVLKNEP